LRHVFNQAKQATLNVLESISQQLLSVLEELELYCNHQPNWIHFEQQQECHDGLASNHD